MSCIQSVAKQLFRVVSCNIFTSCLFERCWALLILTSALLNLTQALNLFIKTCGAYLCNTLVSLGCCKCRFVDSMYCASTFCCCMVSFSSSVGNVPRSIFHMSLSYALHLVSSKVCACVGVKWLSVLWCLLTVSLPTLSLRSCRTVFRLCLSCAVVLRASSGTMSFLHLYSSTARSRGMGFPFGHHTGAFSTMSSYALSLCSLFSWGSRSSGNSRDSCFFVSVEHRILNCSFALRSISPCCANTWSISWILM